MNSIRLIARKTLIAAGAVAQRISRALQYLAAGTLRVDDLKEHSKRFWRSYDVEEYRITAGLTSRERALVDRFITPLHRVLMVGTGYGRDLLPIADLGCSICGVEPVPEAVATVRRMLAQRRLNADMIEGFIEDVDVPGTFDVAIVTAYSCIPERKRRIDVLRKLGRHLNIPGLILVAYEPALSRPTAMIRFAAAMAMLCGSVWHPEHGDQVIPIDSCRFNFTHFFLAEEIESEAATAGFRVLFQDHNVAPGESRAFVVLGLDS